eukprot:scaffold19070_cov111-Skeletonema_dohrnii-CCMP3373.AAC.2
MKAFLLDFFGLSSCLKDDAVDHQVAERSSQRDERRHRRRPRRRMEPEEDRQSYAPRSLPHIDENSPLQRHHSSRRRSGDGSVGSGSLPTQQRRPSKSGSNSSNRSLRNKNVPRKPSFSTDRYSYEGRDDPHALGLSLSETMGHSHDEKDENDVYVDGQSAIRRSSVKDQPQSTRRKKSSRRPSSSRSSNSQRTKLESFIAEQEEMSPPNDDDSVDNVTTISKASINPYRLLNISQSASPHDVYRGYRRKMKEAEMDGGGEKAFHDVGNAYRRIRAEIERQERRTTEKSKRKTTSSGNGNVDNGGGSGRNVERSRSSNRRQRRRLSTSSSLDSDDDEDSISSRATAIGARLKDHRELVNGLFANDNRASDQKSSFNGSTTGNGEVTSLQSAVHSQSQMLSEMNVVPIDAGSTNINERALTINNSCFYLSLAASYLSGVGAFAIDPTVIYSKRSHMNDDSNQTIEMDIATLPKREKQLTMELALQLKRAIEAAVMLVHPDWASSGMVGEEVQAFSDFLVYALDSDSVLGHWSIAVFDEASGFVDVYRGRHYGKIYPPTKVMTRHGRGRKEQLQYKDCDVETKRANTLTLRYIPGHYQPLLPELTKMSNERRKAKKAGKMYDRATLDEILHLLKKWKVLHVVTDGRA